MFKTLHELNYKFEHPSKNDSRVFIIVGVFLMSFFYFALFYPAPQSFHLNGPNSLFFYFFSTNPILSALAFFSAIIGFTLLAIGAGCYSKLSRRIFLVVSIIMMIIGITILLFGLYFKIILYSGQGFLVFMYGFANIIELYRTKELVN